MSSDIEENIGKVRLRIENAARRAGLEPCRVTLLAATKNRSAAQVEEALSSGVRVAGENRVQELLAKIDEVEVEGVWDFIGHLQRNKVKQVGGVVRMIHSVDTVRLAEEIERRAGDAGVLQRVLLQVNVSGEGSKTGLEPGEVAHLLLKARGFKCLDVRGLSAIAPFAEDPQEVRWVFSRLAELGRELEAEVEGFRCSELSMGMSGDFEVAVEEGSTCVRIGTAIFGPRH